MNSRHGLVFGSVNFVQPDLSVSYSFHATAEDTDWGNAEAVSTVAASFLADGAMESIDRFDNREVKIGVQVEGYTSNALAEAEEQLMLECRKGSNELVWTPPDGWGEPAVFEVVSADMDFVLDDMAELRTERRYILTFRCLPFARSRETVRASGPFDGSDVTPVAPVETQIVGPGPAWTLADWSSYWVSTGEWPNGEVAVPDVTADTGRIGRTARYTAPKMPRIPSVSHIWLIWEPAAPITLAGQKYLKVEWQVFGEASGLDGPLYIRGSQGPNGTDPFYPEIVTQASSSLGGADTYLRIPDGVTTVTRIAIQRKYVRNETHIQRFAVSEITAFDRWPFEAGTAGSQQLITLQVEGSARTQASLAISHQSLALGDAVAWTGPQLSGYDPRLTQLRVDGDTPMPDPVRLSGSSRALNAATPETSEIPTANLPEGSYSIYALLRADVAGGQTITWTAETRLGINGLTPTSGFTHLELTTNYQIYEIGRVTLPTVAAQSDARVRLTLKSAGLAYVDEWWAFNTSDGTVTLVKCGTGSPSTGGPSSRLWLDTPSLVRPNPSVWLGTEEDKTDARHASGVTEVIALGSHRVPPGQLACFVASTRAGNVAVHLDYYPRWHTHPKKFT